MKVGIVSMLYPTKRLPIGGLFVQRELDELSKFVDIRLISPIPNQNWPGEEHSGTTSGGYPFIRPFTLGFPRWFKQHLYPASLASTLSRARGFFDGCEMVHAHYAFPDVVATIRAFGRRLPVTATVHGSDVNLFALKPSLGPAIIEALNTTRTVICVSRSLADRLKAIGVTTETEVIPNGVDTVLFSPGSRQEACERLGLDPNRPRVLFIGNFLPVKGIEYLVRAFPQVLKSCPDCQFILLGAAPGGGNVKKYIELARSLGVEGSMAIAEQAPHEHIPVWMRAADVFVLPSLNEGFGIVAAEALACGVPVVATRCGGPEDIVEEGLGFLVPLRSPEELARAVVRALARDGVGNPEELAESARSRFSRQVVTRRILDVYQRVCSGA
ncbi:MAG: glycosyltransferase [Candidatus Latescibacterota bacterium]